MAVAWVLECCLSFLCFAPGDRNIGNAWLLNRLKVSFPFILLQMVGKWEIRLLCSVCTRQFACASSNICHLNGKYWQVSHDQICYKYDLSGEICLDSIGVRLFQKLPQQVSSLLFLMPYGLCPTIVVFCLWGPGERGPRPIERALWQKGLHVGP